MRYEAEPRTAQAAAGHRVQAVGLEGDGFSVGPGPLAQNPVVMRRAGGLELKRGFIPLIVEPVQGIFVLLGGDGLIQNVLAPARGNQKEDMVRRGPEIHGELLNLRNLIQIGLGDRGVDLKLDARIPGGPNAADRALKGAVHAPEPVVHLFGSAVQADADAPDAGFGHFFGRNRIDQGAVGRHDHAKPFLCAVGGQFENIGPEQGLSAGENHDGLPDLGDLVQQPQGGFGIQFSLVGALGGRGPAVHAGKVAVSRGFPGHQPKGR